MPDDLKSRSSECSPRRLAKKIESCIYRNALDEEQRAQKALYLLQARDRRIALLEKRVAELEDAATNLHELTLRNSSRGSILELDSVASGKARSCKSECDFDVDSTGRGGIREDLRRGGGGEEEDRCEPSSMMNGRVSIPCLDLSKSSESASDIFSTAIDFVMEKSKCFPSNTSFSVEEEGTERDELNENLGNRVAESRSETKLGASSGNVVGRREDEEGVGNRGESKNKDCMGWRSEEKVRAASICNKYQRSNFPRLTSSVPWIRAKHKSFRKKLRGYELKAGKRIKDASYGDGHLAFAAFQTTENTSTDRRQGEGEIVDISKKNERNTMNREQDASLLLAGAQETRSVADKKIDMERKTICTQTSMEAIQFNEKNQDNKVESDMNQFPPCIYLKQKKSSAFWYIDEDPAPQWLIEEALASGTEQTKEKISSNMETEYKTIIAELEIQLTKTREELEEALKAKSAAKEKYKKSLENVKAEARKENEMLQERIVRICTSVLENFGPYSMDRKRCSSFQTKPRKLKYQKKIINKLHKKLRMAVTKLNKLKQELATTRKMLKDKSEEHDSMSKCFDQLKEEMEAAETNLNELIRENVSLRKKIDETREWLQQTSGKEHNMIRDTRNREMVNLKKKVEEDSATIVQLKQKLIRSDSANANKGFLLNSYKSQLKDLTKENNQLTSKINSLENEISNIRSTNSQLRAKISVLNVEKDKLLSDKEKSKTDIKDKMETKCTKKYEEKIQENEVMKTKYEEIIKTLKTKMLITQNENIEYLNAIKEFLKKLYYEYQADYKSHKNLNESEASEREAQETACNILNMTPDELSGFINGKTQNSINSWIVELNRITKTDHFSKDLSKFLLKKAVKKIKT